MKLTSRPAVLALAALVLPLGLAAQHADEKTGEVMVTPGYASAESRLEPGRVD